MGGEQSLSASAYSNGSSTGRAPPGPLDAGRVPSGPLDAGRVPSGPLDAGRAPSCAIDARRLVELYLDRVYRFAYRLTGSRADAEDLVQETFLVAQEKGHQIRAEESALFWLLKVVRSCWARRARRPFPICGEITVENIPDEDEEPSGGLEDVDGDRLLELLASMPEDYRQPLLLCYFEDLRYREIAEILECPLGTVMSRIARGKAYLRTHLAAEVCSKDG